MNVPTESYFVKYTSLVKETNIIEAFAAQKESIEKFYNSISEEKSNYAYAEGKWTLKEMLQHIIDTERVFAYRALAIARKETATLPSFDENEYAANTTANDRTWASLITEFNAVRLSTQLMFETFNKNMLTQVGNFSSLSGTPETLGFIMVGHVYHHIKIAEERYF
jgi:uncharacterized damage-inducible protein DinB